MVAQAPPTHDLIIHPVPYAGVATRAVALAMDENIKAVGLPTWSDADVKLAKGIQAELKAPIIGLAVALKGAPAPPPAPRPSVARPPPPGDGHRRCCACSAA